MKNLTFKRIMSFVVIVAMVLSVLAVSVVAETAKFDLVIEGPESFTAGDEIEVFVKVKNITATNGTLNGLTSLTGTLWYDNSRMVLTNDLDEDNADAVLCVESAPNTWKNESITECTFDEDAYLSTPKNSGWIELNLYTNSKNQANLAVEDDSITLKFTFKVNNTAYGDIELFFDTDVEGDTNGTPCDGNGTSLVIVDPTYEPPVSEDTSDTSEPEDNTPDYTYIDINRINVYGGPNEVCAWNSDDEEITVETRYAGVAGAKTFQWLYKAWLQYDTETGKFVCLDTETIGEGCNRYETEWKLGYGRMIIMAHPSMVSNVPAMEAIMNMQVGDEFHLIGFPDQEAAFGENPEAPREHNFDSALYYAGYVDMALIAADAEDEIPEDAVIWTPEYPEDILPIPEGYDPYNPEEAPADPTGPDFSKGIEIDRNNAYESLQEVVIWNSDDEEVTVEMRYCGTPGGATFQWFYKVLLEYNEETGKYDVIDTEALGDGANRYETEWKLGPGRIVLMAHDENRSINALNVIALKVGDSCYFDGDLEELYYTAGPVDLKLTFDKAAEDEGEDNVIDGTEDEENENSKPEAGDASSALILVVLALVSLAGSAVVVKTRK